MLLADDHAATLPNIVLMDIAMTDPGGRAFLRFFLIFAD